MSISLASEPSAPRLDRLVLRDVRCFADAVVPLGPRVTVILGENGSGKTTIAEALASLCAGEGEGLAEIPKRRGADVGSMALYEVGREEAVASWSSGGERQRLAYDRWLFAYGRYRRVQYPEEQKLPVAPFGPEWAAEDIEAGLVAKLPDIVGRRRTITLSRPDNHLLRDLGRCNEAKSNNWPVRGGYVRPDKMDPGGRFLFHDDGRIEGASKDQQAKLTVDGIQLNRGGLRKLRSVQIAQTLRTLIPLLEDPTLATSSKLTHARRYLLPALSPYSEAVNQSVKRAWAARFPYVTM